VEVTERDVGIRAFGQQREKIKSKGRGSQWYGRRALKGKAESTRKASWRRSKKRKEKSRRRGGKIGS